MQVQKYDAAGRSRDIFGRAELFPFLCTAINHGILQTMTSETTLDIQVEKVATSRLSEFDPANIQFGKQYADHMLVCDYENGQWGTPRIVPYGTIEMSPATTVLHYGQAIFEGVKAYRQENGEIVIFRPDKNWERFNRSAERMAMPAIPEDLFLEGLRQLIKTDSGWVPEGEGTSLYLRPFMIGTDAFIGVKPAEKFSFIIITSPAGPYYSKPVSIYVQDEYVRAFPGGTGFAKNAGNYGACMAPTMKARSLGYDQILWTDGFEHKYVQEIGTMNVWFVIGDKAVTPSLDGGTILEGVTRDSVATLLREHGITVEERPITTDELVQAFRNGELKEAFGTGTAASIAPIAELTIHGEHMKLPPVEEWKVANWVKQEMNNIRYGITPDTRGWIFKV